MEAEPLTAACELAFAVAREDREAVPPIEPPAPMRSFLYVAQLPKRAISVAQRVIDEDPEFRTRVAARATEANVGSAGYAWLHRTAGWENYAGGTTSSVLPSVPPAPPAPPVDVVASPSSVDDVPPVPAPPAPAAVVPPSAGNPSAGNPADPGDANSSAAIEDELTNLRSLVDRLADERKVVSSSVHELESEVEQRRSQSTGLQDELDMLRSDLDASRTTEATAVSRASQLEGQLADLQSSSVRLDSERRAAQDRLEQTEAELVIAQRSLLSTEQALQAAQADLANAEQQLASSQQGLGSIESSLAEKDSTIAEKDAALAAMHAAVAERDAALADKEATLGARESAVASLDADLASKNAELSLRSSELSEARERLASIEALVADRDAGLADRDAVIAERDAGLAERDAALADRDAALAERADALQAKEAALADVTERVSALEAVVAERDAMLEARDAELATGRSDLVAKSDELDAANQRLDAVESSLAETRAEHDRVASRLVDAEAVAAQLDVLRDDLSEAQNEREDLRARLEVAEQARVDLEDQLSAVSSQWRDLQVELVQIGEQRATVEHELAQLLEERKQSMTERADLFNDLATRLDRVQAERDLLAAQLAATRSSLDGTRLAFEDATETIGSRLGDTEAAFVDLERANARLAESTENASAIVDHVPTPDAGAAVVAMPDAGSADIDSGDGELDVVDSGSSGDLLDEFMAPEIADVDAADAEVVDSAGIDTNTESMDSAGEVIDPFAVQQDGPGAVAFDADPTAWLPEGVTVADTGDAGELGETMEAQGGELADEATAEIDADTTDVDAMASLSAADLGIDSIAGADSAVADDAPGGAEGDAPVASEEAEQDEAGEDPFASVDLETALTTTGLGAEADPSSLGVIDDIDAATERAEQAVENDRCRIEIPEPLLVDPLAVARHVVATDDVVLLVDGDAVAGMGWPSLSTSDRRTALVSYLGDLAADTGAAPDTIFDGAIGDDDALPVSRAVRVRLTASGIEPASALSELVDSYPREWPVAVVTDNPILAADAEGRGASVLNNGQLLDLFIAP